MKSVEGTPEHKKYAEPLDLLSHGLGPGQVPQGADLNEELRDRLWAPPDAGEQCSAPLQDGARAWARALLALGAARPTVRELKNLADFDKLLAHHAENTGLPVVVDFYSDSCGPCRMIAPVFKKLAAEYKDRAVFAKYNRALPRDGPRDFATAQTAALHLTGLPRRAKLERLGKLYGLGPAACVRRSGSRRAGSGSCRPPPGRRRCAASPRGPRR